MHLTAQIEQLLYKDKHDVYINIKVNEDYFTAGNYRFILI